MLQNKNCPSKKNNLTFFLSLLSNFPLSLKHANTIPAKNFRFRGKKKILKNFLLFLCLINQFNKLTVPEFLAKNYINCSYFIISTKKKTFVLLRAPFRHKLTKKKIFLKRFKIIIKTSIYLNSHTLITKLSDLCLFVTLVKNYFTSFESNLVRQHKLFLNYSFFVKRSLLKIK